MISEWIGFGLRCNRSTTLNPKSVLEIFGIEGQDKMTNPFLLMVFLLILLLLSITTTTKACCNTSPDITMIQKKFSVASW
jgi:hypothetical protein